MVTMPARNTATAAPREADSLERALAFGLRVLDRVHSFALQLDLPSLGDIELPPAVGSAADQAHLQTVGPLYLASELEAALLLPAAETLAGVFISGGIQADVGAAGIEIEAFWKSKHERFTQAERQAFFARLFGSTSGPALATANARNAEFDPLMIDLSAAIYHLEPAPGYGPPPDTEVTLQTAATQLAANLVPRSGGMAAYAGTELLGAVQSALKIFKTPALQRALGAQSLWDAVRAAARMYLSQEVDIDPHLTRGKSGMLVLNWLAQALPSLGGSAGTLTVPDASVVSAATAWLQSSLSLSDQQQQPAGALG
jgi:hypothetical protein